MGRTNDEAATAARNASIPVHTIAFGTDAGTIVDPYGEVVPVPVNEAALEKLAQQTNGRSLTAATAEQLSQVYEDLGRSVQVNDRADRDRRLVRRSGTGGLEPGRLRLFGLVRPTPLKRPDPTVSGGH